jgi:hypothetical protein
MAKTGPKSSNAAAGTTARYNSTVNPMRSILPIQNGRIVSLRDGPETKSRQTWRATNTPKDKEHGNAQHAARHIAVGLVSPKLFKILPLRIVQISQQPVVPHAAKMEHNASADFVTVVQRGCRSIQTTGNDKCRMLTHESKAHTESNKDGIKGIEFVAGKQ